MELGTPRRGWEDIDGRVLLDVPRGTVDGPSDAPGWAVKELGHKGCAPVQVQKVHACERDTSQMIYRFPVGRLSCAVVSDGQLAPPWAPPLAAFLLPTLECQPTSCEMPWRRKDAAGPR